MSDSNAELANRVAEACRFSLSDGKDETIAQVDVVEQGGVHWLTNLWVHPDHRGRGYARACLQRAIDRYGHLPLYLKIAPFTDQPVAAKQLALLYADFGFLATAVPGVMSRPVLRWKVGDKVFVVSDNYGNDAEIVAMRTHTDWGYPSHYKVRIESGSEFWAFDHEVNDP